MPPRDHRFRLQDILDAIRKVESYTAGLNLESFGADEMRVDAVVRNLEVIGEAASHLDEATMALCPNVDWTLVRRARVFLAHKYFGVSVEIVWQTVQTDLPVLRADVEVAVGTLGPDPK